MSSGYLKPTDPKKTLLRLFSYFKFNKVLFFGGLSFIIIGSIAEIGATSMLSPIIDLLVGDYNLSTMIRYILIMMGFVVILAGGQYFGNLFMARLIVVSVVTVVGTFIMMLILSPTLTLIVVIMLVVMMNAIKFIGKKSSKNFRNQQAALAGMNGYIEEMMSGQKVVKVFNYEDRAIDNFSKRLSKIENSKDIKEK